MDSANLTRQLRCVGYGSSEKRYRWRHAVSCCLAVRVGGFFFFSSRRRHTRFDCDWSSDVCSSDLILPSTAPTRSGIGCDRTVTRVTIPKVPPPPPRRAQNRSWFWALLATTVRPSAVDRKSVV